MVAFAIVLALVSPSLAVRTLVKESTAMETDDTSQVVAAARLSMEANHSKPWGPTAWYNWDPDPCPVGQRMFDGDDKSQGLDCVLVLTHEENEDACGSEELQKCSVQRDNGEVYLAKRKALYAGFFCPQEYTTVTTTTYAPTMSCSSVGFRRCASLAHDDEHLVQILSATSDEHCARLCAEMILCTAWSYQPSTSRCSFTRSDEPRVAPVDEGGINAGTRCVPTSCGTNSLRVFRGNRQFVIEQLHDTKKADSDEGCAQVCASRPQCTAWTYDVYSNDCRITHDPNPKWTYGNHRTNGGEKCVLQRTPWVTPL